jgi:hypothetical protein
MLAFTHTDIHLSAYTKVVGLKWKQKHGCDAMMLGAGHSKQKSLHPGLAGFFLKHVSKE